MTKAETVRKIELLSDVEFPNLHELTKKELEMISKMAVVYAAKTQSETSSSSKEAL